MFLGSGIIDANFFAGRLGGRMSQLVRVCCLGICIAAGAANAGSGDSHDSGGHSHSAISKEAAIEKATAKVADLAKAGKIDSSWTNAPVASAEQKTFSKGPEWVVTFSNDKVADASKRTLYVFFDQFGHYLAANYTGN